MRRFATRANFAAPISAALGSAAAWQLGQLNVAAADSGKSLPCTWLRPEKSKHSLCGTSVQVSGSHGSLWQSREQRIAQGWPDVGPPENVLVFENPQPPQLDTWVSCTPHGDGAQAGVYMYKDDTTWVKFVLESCADGSVALILAEQVNGKPFVVGKMILPPSYSKKRAVSLRFLPVKERGVAVAEFSLNHGREWQALERGLGWLRPSELAAGQPYGSLSLDDPRSKERAECRMPSEWKFALVTEQWPADDVEGSPREVSFVLNQYVDVE